MPYVVKKGNGKRPYKIVHARTGKQVGSATSKRRASISASIRNRSH